MEIGKDGSIVVEEGLTETESDTVKGMEIGSGSLSDHFLDKNKEITLINPHILVTHETIDNIESLTGINFFSSLSDDIENRIEAGVNTSSWSW